MAESYKVCVCVASGISFCVGLRALGPPLIGGDNPHAKVLAGC